MGFWHYGSYILFLGSWACVVMSFYYFSSCFVFLFFFLIILEAFVHCKMGSHAYICPYTKGQQDSLAEKRIGEGGEVLEEKDKRAG